MKKRIIIPLIVLVLFFIGLYAWINRINYDVYENISNVEINPVEGVDFHIDATRKSGNLKIENNSDRYIVIEFGRKRIQIEIQKEDGWYPIVAHNIVHAEPCAIPENSTYSLDFTWRNFIDGPLKPGKYRAILFFGDKMSEVYTYSATTEFSVY